MSKKLFFGKMEAAKILKRNVQTILRYCKELLPISNGHIELLACGYVMDSRGLELIRKNLSDVGISKTRAKA